MFLCARIVTTATEEQRYRLSPRISHSYYSRAERWLQTHVHTAQSCHILLQHKNPILGYTNMEASRGSNCIPVALYIHTKLYKCGVSMLHNYLPRFPLGNKALTTLVIYCGEGVIWLSNHRLNKIITHTERTTCYIYSHSYHMDTDIIRGQMCCLYSNTWWLSYTTYTPIIAHLKVFLQTVCWRYRTLYMCSN